MDPIGAGEEEWSIGYGQTYEVDGLPLCANWGGGSYTARAVARVGRLMLRKGDWEGRQLVESKWVECVVAYAGTSLPDRPPGDPRPGSGLGWWTNFDRVWSAVPRNAFAGSGAGNQLLFVVPSLDLIVVRNRAQIGDESKGEGHWGGEIPSQSADGCHQRLRLEACPRPGRVKPPANIELTERQKILFREPANPGNFFPSLFESESE